MAFLAFVWICLLSASVWASTGIAPTNKNAWAENTGWANASPTYGGVTVHFNGTSGYLTGYAWGENVGWIKFNSVYNQRSNVSGVKSMPALKRGRWIMSVDTGPLMSAPRGPWFGQSVVWTCAPRLAGVTS